MINIVVAYDRKHAIGKGGGLLWKMGQLCGDMKHFKELTMGSVLIMGRKTFDSIGTVLPGRKTIVCTRNETVNIPDVEIARSLNEAYSLADGYDEIFIVGGGQIYSQALKDAQRIFATEVDAEIFGADTYFPTIDDCWRKTDEQRFLADDKNIYPYSFVTYGRA